MYPFIALLFDSGEPTIAPVIEDLVMKIRSALPGYELAFDGDGMLVLCDRPVDVSMRTYRLQRNAGLVLGRLFPMEMNLWHAGWSWSPSDADTDQICRSRGEWLTRNTWGAYVAFINDQPSACNLVIRDCSGKLPCYRARHNRIDIFFADPADARSAGLIRPDLNWNYICAFLCSSQLQIRGTALDGVTELLAGDRFGRLGADRYCQDSAWTPIRAYHQPPIAQFEMAVDSVRSTAIACVEAWASVYGSILHTLSGGLDSTIVLACLSQVRGSSSAICVNTFGSSAGEDERDFARLAASAANVRLIELPMTSEDLVLDEHLLALPLTCKPTIPATIGWLGLAVIDALATRVGAQSIWTGQGGDHLFMQTSMPVAPLDYAALNGYGFSLLKFIQDSVNLSGLSYWRVMSLLRKGDLRDISRALNESPAADQPFLIPDVRKQVRAEYLAHPWTTAIDTSLAPGRRLQLTALGEVLNRHRPLPRTQTTFEHHPLLSQPLVETCLRIPSYLHLRGGIDRAVERAAFEDLIPKSIVSRRQKGQSTISILEIIHRSDRFIRNLLLDGYLKHEGILDQAAIEPYLAAQRPLELPLVFPLLSCIAAELWLGNYFNARSSYPRSHDRLLAHAKAPIRARKPGTA